MIRNSETLPHLADAVALADGGLETSLIFHDGHDLPEFAAFVLMDDEPGREALRRYYRPYLALAAESGCAFVLETPTWRASSDWGARLDRPGDRLDEVNRAAVALMQELRDESGSTAPVAISGCVGPRFDAYRPAERMTPLEARDYHAPQVATFADTTADLVTGVTFTGSEEAIGLSLAAADHGIPVVVSFTVETDGRLPSGETLGEAITTVDEATGNGPAAYMVNCAHPTHVEAALRVAEPWTARVRGLRANASTLSHEELDAAEELDEGDPQDLGARYAALRADLPQLSVLGGCCGTDLRHVRAIRDACLHDGSR